MAFQPPSRAVPVVQPVSTASRLDHIHPSRWSVDDVHYYFANTARQGGIATILRNLKVDGPTLLGYNNREAAVQTLGLKSYPQRTRYFECLQKLITQYNLPQPPKEKPPKGSKSATPPSDQATSKWTKRKRHRDLSLRCALADTAVKAAGVSKGPNAASITATCPPLVKPDPNRDILARSSPARHNPTKRRLTEPEPRPGQLTGSTKGKSSSHSPRSTKSSTPRNHPTANHLASTGKVNTGRAKTYMWSVKPIDGKVQQVTLSPSPNPTSTSNGSPVEAGSDRTKHSHSSADLTVETPHDKNQVQGIGRYKAYRRPTSPHQSSAISPSSDSSRDRRHSSHHRTNDFQDGPRSFNRAVSPSRPEPRSPPQHFHQTVNRLTQDSHKGPRPAIRQSRSRSRSQSRSPTRYSRHQPLTSHPLHDHQNFSDPNSICSDSTPRHQMLYSVRPRPPLVTPLKEDAVLVALFPPANQTNHSSPDYMEDDAEISPPQSPGNSPRSVLADLIHGTPTTYRAPPRAYPLLFTDDEGLNYLAKLFPEDPPLTRRETRFLPPTRLFNTEVFFRHSEGQRRYTNISAAPLYNESGEPVPHSFWFRRPPECPTFSFSGAIPFSGTVPEPDASPDSGPQSGPLDRYLGTRCTIQRKMRRLLANPPVRRYPTQTVYQPIDDPMAPVFIVNRQGIVLSHFQDDMPPPLESGHARSPAPESKDANTVDLCSNDGDKSIDLADLDRDIQDIVDGRLGGLVDLSDACDTFEEMSEDEEMPNGLVDPRAIDDVVPDALTPAVPLSGDTPMAASSLSRFFSVAVDRSALATGNSPTSRALDFDADGIRQDPDDPILPLYGESDYATEELDSSDMSGDEITSAKAPGGESATPASLPIDALVDEFLVGYREEWRARKQPKLEARQWKLWHTEQARLDEFKDQLEYLKEDRLPRHIKALRDMGIRNSREFRRIGVTLCETVFSMSELEWKIQLVSGPVPETPVFARSSKQESPSSTTPTSRFKRKPLRDQTADGKPDVSPSISTQSQPVKPPGAPPKFAKSDQNMKPAVGSTSAKEPDNMDLSDDDSDDDWDNFIDDSDMLPEDHERFGHYLKGPKRAPTIRKRRGTPIIRSPSLTGELSDDAPSADGPVPLPIQPGSPSPPIEEEQAPTAPLKVVSGPPAATITPEPKSSPEPRPTLPVSSSKTEAKVEVEIDVDDEPQLPAAIKVAQSPIALSSPGYTTQLSPVEEITLASGFVPIPPPPIRVSRINEVIVLDSTDSEDEGVDMDISAPQSPKASSPSTAAAPRVTVPSTRTSTTTNIKPDSPSMSIGSLLNLPPETAKPTGTNCKAPLFARPPSPTLPRLSTGIGKLPLNSGGAGGGLLKNPNVADSNTPAAPSPRSLSDYVREALRSASSTNNNTLKKLGDFLLDPSALSSKDDQPSENSPANQVKGRKNIRPIREEGEDVLKLRNTIREKEEAYQNRLRELANQPSEPITALTTGDPEATSDRQTKPNPAADETTAPESSQVPRVIINLGHDPGESDIYIPSFLARHIKPHQVEGVRFMWKNLVMFAKSGCILAHAMGLGKTFQVIVIVFVLLEEVRKGNPAIPEHFRSRRILILLPPTLRKNWMREINTWIPKTWLRRTIGHVFALDGTIHKNTEARLAYLHDWYEHGGILLTGYQLFRDLSIGMSTSGKTPLSDDELTLYQRYLLDPGPALVVADEGHTIKNPNSKVSIATKRFKTKSRVCLTGYPLQNNLSEYWCMVDFVHPGCLGHLADFRNAYVHPIENGMYPDSTRSDVRLFRTKLYILHDILKDFVLRREPVVLQRELPPKREFVITCKLPALQHSLYTEILENELQYGNAFNAGKGLIANEIILRNICNHPYIFKLSLNKRFRAIQPRGSSGSSYSSSGGDGQYKTLPLETDEDGQAIPEEDGEKLEAMIPFLVAITDKAFQRVPDYKDISHGIKMVVLMHMAEMCVRNGDKMLIFSRGIPTLDYIESIFRTASWSSFTNKRRYMRLDGTTNMAARQPLVEEFNSNPNLNFFLISSGTGSLGLNLPSANRVVLMDAGWNPSFDEQAIARAYRYGQTKPVFVYRLTTCGTMEDKVLKNNVHKIGLSKRVVDHKNVEKRYTKSQLKSYLDIPPSDPPSLVPYIRARLPLDQDPYLRSIVDTLADQLVNIDERSLDSPIVEDEMTAEHLYEANCMLQMERDRISGKPVAPIPVQGLLPTERPVPIYDTNGRDITHTFPNYQPPQLPSAPASDPAPVPPPLPPIPTSQMPSTHLMDFHGFSEQQP
ncbi:hypothetical protein H4R33_003821 [Dimargaris cristalligena]|nr:hypothetical protein H4R33_003821 [Dimargaris cristalligena]